MSVTFPAPCPFGQLVHPCRGRRRKLAAAQERGALQCGGEATATPRPAQRGEGLEFGHSLRTPWATEGPTPCVAAPRTGAWRLSAAVGGTRSIAPGFSRVETAKIELSPCSGRQAAEVGHRDIKPQDLAG